MAKENHNLLESMKEAILKDPHLTDQILTIIRNARAVAGHDADGGNGKIGEVD